MHVKGPSDGQYQGENADCPITKHSGVNQAGQLFLLLGGRILRNVADDGGTNSEIKKAVVAS